MSFVTSRRWALQETLRGLRRDAAPFVFATCLSALALSIPLFIACIFYGLSEPLRSLPTAVEITVFTTEKADAARVEEEIRRIEEVVSTRIIKKEEAYAELNERLGIKPAKSASNPLPDIVIATLANDLSNAKIEDAAKAIEAIRGVDFVPYEISWHEKLQAVTRAANVGLVCLGSVVLLLVVLVLGTAVRLTSSSARSEMRALHLFGASPSFAVRPYAWRGFLLMGASAALALGITEIGLIVFGRAVAFVASLYDAAVSLTLPPADWCLGIVFGCAVVGSIVASAVAADTGRQIRGGTR